MGFRTVVIVSNDRLDEVQDPVLKDMILGWWGRDRDRNYMQGPYRVVEQVHCDHTSLLSVLHLDAKPIGSSYWNHPTYELEMVKEAAERLGYKLIRQSVKK